MLGVYLKTHDVIRCPGSLGVGRIHPKQRVGVDAHITPRTPLNLPKILEKTGFFAGGHV